MSKIVFGIYVAGSAIRNAPSINAFKEVCAQQLHAGAYEIRVVDIIDDPSAAENKKLMAVPVIIREYPSPERRIIGDTRHPQKASRAFEFLMEEIQTEKPS